MIDAVAVIQDKEISVPVACHEEKFLELIEMNDFAGIHIQPVQPVIRLYPAYPPGRIHHVVYKISRKVVRPVGNPVFEYPLPVIDVETVAGSYPHQTSAVLTKRRNGTVCHIFLVGNLFEIVRIYIICQRVKRKQQCQYTKSSHSIPDKCGYFLQSYPKSVSVIYPAGNYG